MPTDPQDQQLTLDDISRLTWQALAELSLIDIERLPLSQNQLPFSVRGDHSHALYHRVNEAACKLLGVPLAHTSRMPSGWRQEIDDVYQEALSLCLVGPSARGQSLDWNAASGVFHFTRRGRQYLQRQDVPPHSASLLRQRLVEVQQRTGLSDAQITLMIEAQRCWGFGAYRAAIVLVGLAAEDLCIALLDQFAAYPHPPQTGHALFSDWTQLTNTTSTFAARWAPGLRVLGVLKGRLRTLGRGQSWWEPWEPVPDALRAFGEAVRLGRNAGAHDPIRGFTAAEVGLLIAAGPTLFEILATLTGQLADAALTSGWPDLNQ